MMGAQVRIARRYAQAFLNVYGSKLTQKDFVALQKLEQFFDHNKWYMFLLKVPVLDQEKKRQAVNGILIDRFELPDVFKKLTHILCQERRLSLISEIIRQISALHCVATDTHVFVVSSSSDLTLDEQKEIKRFLNTHVKHVMIKDYKKDTDLIAGLRMQSDTRLWEYSVRKQLASCAAAAGIPRKD